MKLKKHAKPLAEATIGDLTERKCAYCGLYLQFAEVDHEEKVAWISCPTFLSNPEFNRDQHSSYTVPLAETGYHEGDEAKPHHGQPKESTKAKTTEVH